MIRVELGERLEGFVESLVANGRYPSQVEVLQDALRLVEERETRLAELDAAIAKGIASANAGLLYDADEVFDELEARYSAMIDDET